MIALTFDVDFVDWVDGDGCDELADAFPVVQQVLRDYPDVRTTWFVRLDRGMRRRFGRADEGFIANACAIDWLRANGHEVAWHHHAERADSNKPVHSAMELVTGLERYSDLAKLHGCTSVRMGWGQHTAESLAFLADAGWNADSTAMPRPAYSWDPPLRNWEGAPAIAYFPSRPVIAAEGNRENALSIIEIPMSMATITSTTDTIPGMKRYVNTAYHPHVFGEAVKQIPTHMPIVTICHPYELLGGRAHQLYAFSTCAFRRNLDTLRERCSPFVTITEMANAARLPEIHAHAA